MFGQTPSKDAKVPLTQGARCFFLRVNTFGWDSVSRQTRPYILLLCSITLPQENPQKIGWSKFQNVCLGVAGCRLNLARNVSWYLEKKSPLINLGLFKFLFMPICHDFLVEGLCLQPNWSTDLQRATKSDVTSRLYRLWPGLDLFSLALGMQYSELSPFLHSTAKSGQVIFGIQNRHQRRRE